MCGTWFIGRTVANGIVLHVLAWAELEPVGLPGSSKMGKLQAMSPLFCLSYCFKMTHLIIGKLLILLTMVPLIKKGALMLLKLAEIRRVPKLW